MKKSVENKKILKKIKIKYEKFIIEIRKISYKELKKKNTNNKNELYRRRHWKYFNKSLFVNKEFKISKSIIFDTKKIFEKNFFKKIIKDFTKKRLNLKILFSSVVPLALKQIKKNF